MNHPNGHIRAFIAISLPEETKNCLHDLQRQLQKSGVKASWPRPGALHLTLKFLGNIPAHTMETLTTSMTQAVVGIPAHTLFLSGMGVFPSVKNVRVIWSGTKGQTDVLKTLATRLESLLYKDLGVKKEKRKFFPHLTLARIKQPVFPKTMVTLLQEFKDFRCDDFLVSEIKLYQSELRSSGAVYTLLFSAPFKN